MAVDIECYIERWTPGGWVFTGELMDNPERKYDEQAPLFAHVPAFHSDQKELAAILLDTGRPIRSTEAYQAVVDYRGLPKDLSRELQDYFRYFEDDEFVEYSWFGTQELIDFALPSRKMVRQAFVDSDLAHLFADCPQGFPYSNWPDDRPISYAEWRRNGTQVRWVESYDSIVREFSEVFPAALLKEGAADQTRLIVQGSW